MKLKEQQIMIYYYYSFSYYDHKFQLVVKLRKCVSKKKIK